MIGAQIALPFVNSIDQSLIYRSFYKVFATFDDVLIDSANGDSYAKRQFKPNEPYKRTCCDGH